MPIIVNIMPGKYPHFSQPRKVTALAYEGLCTFEFGIVVELFGLSRPELDTWYSFEVCALEKGPLRAIGGVRVLPKRGISALLHADTIIIPGWRNPDEPPPQRLIRTLLAAHRRGSRLVSICSGIFVLAATGLLDGRRATTHWRYADKLKSAFPLVLLQPDVLYVDEGDILTSAGSAAGIDLCLYIIRKDFGAAVANQVARRLVVSPHREGGQAQFIERPINEQSRPWLSNLLETIQNRLHEPLTVQDLANYASTSTRTLSRRFAQTTGCSPMEWITSLRVRRAKDLLETTALSVEEIADRCGFGAAPTLRHHFRSRVQLSPNSYRARFRTAETKGATKGSLSGRGRRVTL
jgi:AraC family transcriptional activator FtrA